MMMTGSPSDFKDAEADFKDVEELRDTTPVFEGSNDQVNVDDMGTTSAYTPPAEIIKAEVAPATVGAVVAQGSKGEAGNIKPSRKFEAVFEKAEGASAAMKEQWQTLVAKSPPFVQTYVTTIRPWIPFFKFEVPETGEEVKHRLEVNLMHYCANYLLILLLFLIGMLFSHPARLICTVTVVVAWAVYARVGGLDPNWRPAVKGVEILSSHRLMLMSASSVCFLFFVAGDLVLMLVGCSALLTIAHAAMHPGVTPAKYQTVSDPSEMF